MRPQGGKRCAVEAGAGGAGAQGTEDGINLNIMPTECCYVASQAATTTGLSTRATAS